MHEIPSSSPLWSPLKRRKVLNTELLEPNVLFPANSQLGSSLLDCGPDSEQKSILLSEVQCPATPPCLIANEKHHLNRSFQKAIALTSLAIFDSDSEIDAEQLAPSANTEVPAEIPSSQWYEDILNLVPHPGKQAISTGTSKTDSNSSSVIGGGDGEVDLSQGETDSDEGVNTSTQQYLQELLTESMIESLPLPPARRRAVGVALE